MASGDRAGHGLGQPTAVVTILWRADLRQTAQVRHAVELAGLCVQLAAGTAGSVDRWAVHSGELHPAGHGRRLQQ